MNNNIELENQLIWCQHQIARLIKRNEQIYFPIPFLYPHSSSLFLHLTTCQVASQLQQNPNCWGATCCKLLLYSTGCTQLQATALYITEPILCMAITLNKTDFTRHSITAGLSSPIGQRNEISACQHQHLYNKVMSLWECARHVEKPWQLRLRIPGCKWRFAETRYFCRTTVHRTTFHMHIWKTYDTT